MVLVDSSIWIEAARRTGNLEVKVGLEGLLYEFEATWCGPIKLEVLGGARANERKALSAWFECIPYLPITEPVWEEAKTLGWKLRDTGFSIPWNDILIAALGMRSQCRVYARDHHFETMRDVLGLRLYEPDYGGKFRPE